MANIYEMKILDPARRVNRVKLEKVDCRTKWRR